MAVAYHFLKKLFTESNGKPSLMRVQSFLTLLFAFVVIIYQIKLDKVYFNLDFLLIVAAFVPKSLQKFAEIRIRLPTIKNEKEDGTHHDSNHNHQRYSLN